MNDIKLSELNLAKNTRPAMSSPAPRQKASVVEQPPLGQTPSTASQAVNQQERAVSQQKTVVSQQKTVVSQQKTVVSQQKTVVSQQKTVVSQQQTVVSQQPSTISQQQTVVSQQPTAVSEQQLEEQREELKEAVTKLNDYVQSVQRDLQFELDDSSGKIVITVVDRQTEEVVRQIPDEIALQLARKLQEDESLNLFNAKA